nr:O(6)-methylguanine-induced apoptosis 2 isoform X2 [Anser cygnoides]
MSGSNTDPDPMKCRWFCHDTAVTLRSWRTRLASPPASRQLQQSQAEAFERRPAERGASRVAPGRTAPEFSQTRHPWPLSSGSEFGEGFQISSSPYKHHCKVISNSEKKGFNSQSKRFQYNQSENPGPGFYNVTHQSPEINSTSLSKKGTGYFPSLVPRTACKKISSYPAVNAYNILSYFQSRRDFSVGNSRVFQQPVSRKIEKIPTPAPNQYHVTTTSAIPSPRCLPRV